MIRRIVIFLFLIINFNQIVFAQTYQSVNNYNEGVGYSQVGLYMPAIQKFQQAIDCDPTFVKAYLQLGICLFNIKEYKASKKFFFKVLKLEPDNENAKKMLLKCYYTLAHDYTVNKSYYQALSEMNGYINKEKNDVDAYLLRAGIYTELKKYKLSIDDYNKVLSINPENKIAMNNKKVIQIKMDQDKYIKRINNLKYKQNVPAQLFSQVHITSAHDPNVQSNTNKILDILWNDSDGQKLLNVILQNNIPINIISSSSGSNANIETQERKHYIGILGIPIIKYKTEKNKTISANISENHINGFFNSIFFIEEREVHLQVVVHELCHSVRASLTQDDDNSLSEEVSASLIGFNIASRVVKGRDLSVDETDQYARLLLKSALSDNHSKLPVYNSFNDEIQKIGVIPPNLYRYSDIVKVYAQIRNDPDTLQLKKLESLYRQRQYNANY